MSNDKNQVRLTAVEQFQTARLQAKLEQIKAALTGKSADLLSYEEVREKVQAIETNRRELKEIPLDAIVGSVGRYKDFTRHFLPLVAEDEHRWARVHSLTKSMEGLPPIEVYQIDEVYFVRDGNHRVSVARELEATHIEAYVTLVKTAVPLEPDLQPDDLILKERYANFLERTRLDETFPDLDLSMSVAGNYRVLEQQIRVHQHWVKEHKNEDISYAKAAVRWYEYIYLPVIQMIQERGMMRDFSNRTETDLYVWIDKHRHELAEKLGWTVDMETAVSDLATTQTRDPKLVAQRLSQKVRDALLPAALEAGPIIGEWRESWLSTKREDRLFNHILVAVDGQESGWHALRQAMRVAWREEGKIFGLHVVATPEAAKSDTAQATKAEFERRCQEAGIPGEMTITIGPVTGTICDRARWADLVVVSLSHPPGPQPVDRLGSQFSQLLRRCPRPVLAVPRVPAQLNHLLLAYDGSPKADEALFVATYLAEQWQVSLTVVVALGKKVTQATADHVQNYLNGRALQATFVIQDAPPATLILETAKQHDCGLILMGGYGLTPVIEIVVGSAVDEVLRSRNRPVLVCR
ncbi:universal stress protein [Candidatus Leptofilum sp.]|uniref:universal stress protein n=1 Tax=Candidatus Leptofilum sp. TaxID=3241576 RepID=UPI003B5AF7A5